MNGSLESDWQARTALLLGEDALDRLSRAHVLVVGLGGVGGIAAELVARAGVGRMTLVDGDIVEAGNRNRQLAALVSTEGLRKTEVLAERLQDINPGLRLTSIAEYLREKRIDEVLAQAPYDCVLDAIDTVSPKLHLILSCIREGIPLVSSMGAGAHLNPEAIRCADISKTKHCPLARVVRQRLRKHGVTHGFDAVFSEELPLETAVREEWDPSLPNKRSVTGTVSYMPTLFGCHCAAAVIRKIAQHP